MSSPCFCVAMERRLLCDRRHQQHIFQVPDPAHLVQEQPHLHLSLRVDRICVQQFPETALLTAVCPVQALRSSYYQNHITYLCDYETVYAPYAIRHR